MPVRCRCLSEQLPDSVVPLDLVSRLRSPSPPLPHYHTPNNMYGPPGGVLGPSWQRHRRPRAEARPHVPAASIFASSEWNAPAHVFGGEAVVRSLPHALGADAARVPYRGAVTTRWKKRRADRASTADQVGLRQRASPTTPRSPTLVFSTAPRLPRAELPRSPGPTTSYRRHNQPPGTPEWSLGGAGVGRIGAPLHKGHELGDFTVPAALTGKTGKVSSVPTAASTSHPPSPTTRTALWRSP